jgi:hypothetical protein
VTTHQVSELLLQYLVDYVREHPQQPRFYEDIHDEAEQSELFSSHGDAEAAERCFLAHVPVLVSGGLPPVCRSCAWPSSPFRFSLSFDDWSWEREEVPREGGPMTWRRALGLEDVVPPRPRPDAPFSHHVAVQTERPNILASLLAPLPSFAEPYAAIPQAIGGVTVREVVPESPSSVLFELWSDELARMLSRLHSGFRRMGELHPQFSRGLDDALLP